MTAVTPDTEALRATIWNGLALGRMSKLVVNVPTVSRAEKETND
jgi:hypothetical protein